MQKIEYLQEDVGMVEVYENDTVVLEEELIELPVEALGVEEHP